MLITVCHCCSSTLAQATDSLQKAFKVVQNSLLQLMLVLNADKTKLVVFSKCKNQMQTTVSVTSPEGNEIEVVHEYKYLVVLIEDSLTFNPHVEKHVKKLRLKLGFYFIK